MEENSEINKQQAVDSGFFSSVFQTNCQPTITKLPCKRDDLYYNMQHQSRGRCVILNYRTFDAPDLGERKGTDKDAEHLDSTFRALNFDVEVFNNKTYADTMKIFSTESQRDHSMNDCFVMCILSHGHDNIIHCRDRSFNSNAIFEYFTGSRCASLVGKPKLFFIQACRGDRFDSGVLVHDSPVATPAFLIPNYADILVFYSTFPGHFSWRNVADGSWFIQTLCKVLKEFYGSKLDLMTQLTIVCSRVAHNYQSRVPDPEMDRKKQIPCIMSTLTRLVHF